MDLGNVLCPGCGRPMTPVACSCESCSLRLEGTFSVSPLASLPVQDQAIVIAFLRSLGSIKKVQEVLGVSFPTARARLERIVENLNGTMTAPDGRDDILERLARGEITVAQAMERL